jgi:hypothetical protein
MTAPGTPWPNPAARLAASVAAMPHPSPHQASAGTVHWWRAACSSTIDEQQINPVDRARQQRPGQPGLAVAGDYLQGMTVGHHGGDRRNCGHDGDC